MFNQKEFQKFNFGWKSLPIGLLVVSTTLWNKLSKMAGISTSYPLNSPSIEWSWITVN